MKQTNHLVLTIGELLIDFFCTETDVDLIDARNFSKQAGGAPANVAAAICKLGGKAAFVGKVGNDPFGEFLKRTLDHQNVDTTMLLKDSTAPTTLAFVSLTRNGERDFVFNRGADGLLRIDEIDVNRVRAAKIVHFGSATALLDDPFRATYFHVMNEAKASEAFISYDPNYRVDLWKGREAEFIQLAKKAISYADFVKVSAEELEIITGTQHQSPGIRYLHDLGASIVTVTLGSRGALLSDGKKQTAIDSIPVQSIDSTGAGDAFVGAVLFQLAHLDDPIQILQDSDQLREFISFANKVGAFVCSKVGAISALPAYDDVIN